MRDTKYIVFFILWLMFMAAAALENTHMMLLILGSYYLGKEFTRI